LDKSLRTPWTERLRTADEAAALVSGGDTVLLPLAPAQPAGLLHALGRRADLRDVRLLCALLQERFPVLEHPGVRVVSQFFGRIERALREDGRPVEHVTSDFHGLELIARRERPRVVASAVAPPDADGFLSFGVHAGASFVPFLEAARDPGRVAITARCRSPAGCPSTVATACTRPRSTWWSSTTRS
jgi:hypothetical protein